MKVKLKNLIDVGVLNLEWVGVSGEKEFQLEDGTKKISRWKFLKANYDENYYFPDDEVIVSEIENAGGSIWKIRNNNGTTCVVKIFNWM